MPVYIYGIIGSKWDGDGNTQDKMREQLAEEEGDEIIVAINSPGGDLFTGLALMNMLRRHEGRVVVEIDGLAASAASVVAMGADEVRMPESSMLMIHNPWGKAIGDFHDMRETADDFEEIRDSMLATYRAKTGKDDDELKEMLDEETWMSAASAVQHGFADTIIKEDEDAQARTAMKIAACDLSIFDEVPDEIARLARIGRHKNAAMANRPAAQLQRGADMKTEKKQEPVSAPEEQTIDAPANAVAREAKAGEANSSSDEIMKRARAEQKAIIGCCDRAKLTPKQKLDVIENAASLDAAKDLIIDIKARDDSAPTVDAANRTVTGMVDEQDRFKEAAVDGILMREAQIDMDRENPYRGHSLLRLAGASIRKSGGRVPTSKRDVFAQAMGVKAASTGTHTGSMFPEILRDAMHKQVLRGYQQVSDDWRQFCSVGSNPDFRERFLSALNAFDDLKETDEGEEYQTISIGERGESLQVAKYGGLVPVTWEMLVNDDTRTLTRLPMRMAAAAARVPSNLAFDVLIDNPTLSQDNTDLFHADHDNTHADALSYDGLEELWVAMTTQTLESPDGDIQDLDIEPSVLIVPRSLERTAREIRAAEFTDTDLQPNTFRDRFEVVSSNRLDRDSTSQYYLAADPSIYDVIEVAFLDGMQEPELLQEEAWNVDQTEFKIRLVCGASPLDFRTLQRGGV